MLNAMETPNSFSQSEEQFYTMMNFLAGEESKHLDLSGLEEFLFQGGRRLCQHLLRDHLAQRGVGDVGACIIGSDGVKRTHKRVLTRTILTLFGPIDIRRLGYSHSSVSSLFPLDAILNLPPIKISYTLQKHFVLEVIESSFQKSYERIKRWTDITITSRQAQSIILNAAEDFQDFYEIRVRKKTEHSSDLPLLILTSDGKGVFVKIDDLRPATQQRARRKTRSKMDDISQAGHTYSKRIATVASVYEIGRYIRQPADIAAHFFTPHPPVSTPSSRPTPSAKRVWAGLKEPGKTVIEAIFREALLRDVHRQKEWGVLVDGDLNQITHFQRVSETLQIPLTIVCDMIHVLRYLWKAGNAFHSNEKDATQWVYERLQHLLNGNARRVATGMRRWATRRHIEKSLRKPIDDCARYLVNHAPYLHYDEYLKKGYPIATGVIEGTCRYLVKDRMEITGARWGLKGAEAVLKLRAIQTSGDFQEYWNFHEKKQFERNHQILYKHPSILQPKKVPDVPS